MTRPLFAFLVSLFLSWQICAAPTAASKKCLFINSYKKGYEWSDGIESAVYATLKDQCDLQSFYMDTKTNDTAEYARMKGLEATEWIESQHPDLVVVADDAAVANVLVAHFKDKELAFVFCGVNWEAKKYGLPFKNATGMIEVAPVEELVKRIQEASPGVKNVIYLSGENHMEHVNYENYSKVFEKHHLQLKPAMVRTMKGWQKAFVEVQKKADVVILANHAGILDWSAEVASETVRKETRKLTVTAQEFMSPLVALSVTKIPQEQGEWAGKVAQEILNGSKPLSIPIAVNRRWNFYVNEEVANLSHTVIPESLRRKANKTAL